MDFLNILTKSSKLIATLGVVAGLGVAALPLGSVFAEVDTTGQATVDVEVLPAIAMTITGNNDAGTQGTSTASTTAAVDNYDNNGDGGTNVEPTGTDPFTSAAIQNTKPSSSYLSITPSAVSGAYADTSFKSTVTVYTNNQDGFTLTLKDAEGTADLVNQSDNTKTIPAGTSLAAGTSAWGYAVDAEAVTTTVSEVPAATETAAEINSTDSYSATGVASNVYYGVSTAHNQAQGIYTDTIIYTATTN